MARMLSHDQNFKNLIIDYPYDALAFFAQSEAEGIAPPVRVVPIRHEQLKERLGDRFRELDVPMVEWPGGEREAYIDFIDIYSALDDNEMQEYTTRYPQENATMSTLSERLREEGMEQGRQQEGVALLKRLISRRFGALDSTTEQRIESATTEELGRWAENVLDAATLEEVFTRH